MSTYPDYIHQLLAHARDEGQWYAIPAEKEKTAAALVDWSFLDKDNDQPGEPANWVKKQIRMLEREGDEDTKEMIEEMRNRHRWTRNITPPSTPPRYDPNEAPFDPRDIPGSTDDDLDDDI